MVCLKQLESGLLLVSGPFRLNGVPLRRVNQAFVMSTSSKVDLSGVDCSKVDDSYFKLDRPERKCNTEGHFFRAELDQNQKDKAAKTVAARKETQKTLDNALVKNVSKTDMMK